MIERWRQPPTARTRILGWYVLLLALALAAALFLQRSFLLAQAVLDADRGMDQEVSELRQLVEVGIDPETAEPFGEDLASVFVTFLERNVPLAGEAIFTIIDGEPFVRDRAGDAFADSELEQRWLEVTDPVRDEAVTDIGTIRYLAVPMVFEGEQQGVFVVTFNMDERLAQIDEVVRVGALVYGSIFLFASLAAWVVAGGVLRPLRVLDETANAISESDFSRRIDVEGNDEIANLAHTFNKMLDRLQEAFSTQRRFVDDAGHELRTPITVIRGQLELLGEDPDERRDTIALVTDELDRMSRIVEDLLALAKAEQPDFVNIHPIDLAEFVEGLAAKGSAFSERPVSVESAQQVVFEGDEQRLTQAMMNLIRNAMEHTPSDAAVTVGAVLTEHEVQMWVRDDGPGIPSQEQGRIFERFARGRDGRRSTEGAGLGLAIVKAIAEGHGGRVGVESGPGGTTFTIAVPAQPDGQSGEDGAT